MDNQHLHLTKPGEESQTSPSLPGEPRSGFRSPLSDFDSGRAALQRDTAAAASLTHNRPAHPHTNITTPHVAPRTNATSTPLRLSRPTDRLSSCAPPVSALRARARKVGRVAPLARHSPCAPPYSALLHAHRAFHTAPHTTQRPTQLTHPQTPRCPFSILALHTTRAHSPATAPHPAPHLPPVPPLAQQLGSATQSIPLGTGPTQACGLFDTNASARTGASRLTTHACAQHHNARRRHRALRPTRAPAALTRTSQPT